MAAALLLAVALQSVSGEPVPFQQGANVHTRLVSDWGSRDGDRFHAVVEFRIDEAWHTYWKNPGTTGMSTTIHWSLPEGMTIESTYQSIPQLYSNRGLVDYVHEDTALFIAEIRVDPQQLSNTTPLRLEARVEWLECEKVCMPGMSELQLDLNDTTQLPSGLGEQIDSLVNAYTDVYPGNYSIAGDQVQIHLDFLPDPSLVDDSFHFFPEMPIVDAAAPQHLTRTDAGLRLQSRKAAHAETPTESIKGWLVATDPSGQQTAWRTELTLDPSATKASAAPAEATAPTNLTLLVGLAFLGGLILNLMPCVFPVIGLKIMGFVEQAGQERRKIILHGLIFTAGVLVSFWVLSSVLLLLRAGGEQLGWGFQLQEPWFNYALILLMLAFALSLSGVFEFGMSAVGVGSDLQHKSGPMGSFFSGVLATIVATPCSAPFLAPALGAALALEAWQAMLLFTCIALGLSTPYLLLSLFPSTLKVLPRPGAWMETFKQFMAFPLYGTAAYLLWALIGQIDDTNQLNLLLSLALFAMAFWIYGRWAAPHRRAKVRRSAIMAGLALMVLSVWIGHPRVQKEFWEPWSPERVEQYVREGRTVYVDFTARWCATCQVNKRVVFGSQEVIDAFERNNIVALKADWTNRDPRITERLHQLGKAAVPVNLVYKNGENEPIILPEVLTPGIVLEALNSN